MDAAGTWATAACIHTYIYLYVYNKKQTKSQALEGWRGLRGYERMGRPLRSRREARHIWGLPGNPSARSPLLLAHTHNVLQSLLAGVLAISTRQRSPPYPQYASQQRAPKRPPSGAPGVAVVAGVCHYQDRHHGGAVLNPVARSKAAADDLGYVVCIVGARAGGWRELRDRMTKSGLGEATGCWRAPAAGRRLLLSARFLNLPGASHQTQYTATGMKRKEEDIAGCMQQRSCTWRPCRAAVTHNWDKQGRHAQSCGGEHQPDSAASKRAL